MRTASFKPTVHLLVCTNRRLPDDPLYGSGGGCSDRGEAVFQAFKDRIAADGAYTAIWATRTGCIGVCPKIGATVAVYPTQGLWTEVEVADVPRLYEDARATLVRDGRAGGGGGGAGNKP